MSILITPLIIEAHDDLWDIESNGGVSDLCTETSRAYASSYYNPSYGPEEAMDDSTGTYWRTLAPGTGDPFPHWWQYNFPYAVQIRKLSITANGPTPTRAPDDFELWASNTGDFSGEQTVLLTQTGITFSPLETKSWNFPNTDYFKYYRINITSNPDADGTQVAEIAMSTENELTRVTCHIDQYDNLKVQDPSGNLLIPYYHVGVFDLVGASEYTEVSSTEAGFYTVNVNDLVGAGESVDKLLPYNNIDSYDVFKVEEGGVAGGYSEDLCVSGTPTASSSYSGTFPSYAVDNGTVWAWISGTGSLPEWWQYDFGDSPKIIIKLRMQEATAWPNDWLKDFTFLASNTGAFGGEETTLVTVSDITWTSGEWKEWTFENTTAYRYYRINITEVASGGWADITEVEMMESGGEEIYVKIPYVNVNLGDDIKHSESITAFTNPYSIDKADVLSYLEGAADLWGPEYTGQGQTNLYHYHNCRNIVFSERLITAATRVRILFKAHSTNASVISGCSIGLRSGETDDFASAPTRVTFDGGSSTTTIPASTYKWSDWIDFIINPSSDYLIHIWQHNGTPGNIYFTQFTTTHITDILYYNASADIDYTMEETVSFSTQTFQTSRLAMAMQFATSNADVRLPFYTVVLSDDIGMSESITAFTNPYLIGIYDLVGASEYTEVLLPYVNVDALDLISLSEWTDIQCSEVGACEIDVSDLLGLSEYTEVALPYLNVMVNDNISASEWVTLFTNPYYIFADDDLGVISRLGSGQINPNDPFGIQDVAEVFIPYLNIDASDIVGLSDVSTLIVNPFFIGVSDLIGVADVSTIFVPYFNLTLSDVIGISDTGTVYLPFFHIGVGDLVGVSESFSILIPSFNISSSDTVGISEGSGLLVPGFNIGIGDLFGLSEMATVAIPVFHIDASDKIGVSDYSSVFSPYFVIDTNDKIGVSEWTDFLTPGVNIGVWDSIGIVEYSLVNAIEAGYYEINAFDLVGLSELTSFLVPQFHISTFDLISIIEDTTVIVGEMGYYDIDIFDQIGFAESATVFVPYFQVSVNDLLRASEYTSFLIPAVFVDVLDKIGIADATTVTIPILYVNASDLVGIGETVEVFVPYACIGVFDLLGFSEYTELYCAAAAACLVNVGDLLGVSDVTDLLVPKYDLSVSDLIGLSDVATVLVSYLHIGIADLFGISESSTVFLPRFQVEVADLLSIIDIPALMVPYYNVGVGDLIGISDTAITFIPLFHIGVWEVIGLSELTDVTLFSSILFIDVHDDLGIWARLAAGGIPVYGQFGISEAVTVFIPYMHIQTSDLIGTADVPGALVPIYQIYQSDLIGLPDGMNLRIPILHVSVNDLLGMAETIVNIIRNLHISAFDLIGVPDVFWTMIQQMNIFVSEDFGAKDFPTTESTVSFYAASGFDQATIKDVIEILVKDYNIQVADTLTLKELVNKEVNFGFFDLNLYDKFALTDIAHVVIPFWAPDAYEKNFPVNAQPLLFEVEGKTVSFDVRTQKISFTIEGRTLTFIMPRKRGQYDVN